MQTPVATHQMLEADWAVGRTLAEADLRATTGAMVLAIRRGEVTSPRRRPSALAAGDVLYLIGDDSDILLARRLLATGP